MGFGELQTAVPGGASAVVPRSPAWAVGTSPTSSLPSPVPATPAAPAAAPPASLAATLARLADSATPLPGAAGTTYDAAGALLDCLLSFLDIFDVNLSHAPPLMARRHARDRVPAASPC